MFRVSAAHRSPIRSVRNICIEMVKMALPLELLRRLHVVKKLAGLSMQLCYVYPGHIERHHASFVIDTIALDRMARVADLHGARRAPPAVISNLIGFWEPAQIIVYRHAGLRIKYFLLKQNRTSGGPQYHINHGQINYFHRRRSCCLSLARS